MEPLPAPAPAGKKSALAFFAVLLALFLPSLLAQWAQPAAGLAATQLFVFLVPALVAASGANLRPARYLRLSPPRPVLVALGALAGLAGYLLAGGIMTLTQQLLPARWVEAYDLTRLFEGPAWQRVTLAIIAVALAPACEETAFRGYVLSTLRLRHRPGVAIAATALLFATLHLDPIRFPALVVLGATFGWLVWRSGSIWPSIAAHAANNAVAAGLLATAPPGPEVRPSTPEIVSAIVLGGAALAAVLGVYRALTPAPPPAEAAVVLRDPSRPSIAFDPADVPPPLRAVALGGVALLVALALLGLARGAGAAR